MRFYSYVGFLLNDRVTPKSKPTQKKDVKLKGKGVSKRISVLPSQEAENRSDSSDPETAVASEIGALNSGMAIKWLTKSMLISLSRESVKREA